MHFIFLVTVAVDVAPDPSFNAASIGLHTKFLGFMLAVLIVSVCGTLVVMFWGVNGTVDIDHDVWVPCVEMWFPCIS